MNEFIACFLHFLDLHGLYSYVPKFAVNFVFLELYQICSSFTFSYDDRPVSVPPEREKTK